MYEFQGDINMSGQEPVSGPGRTGSEGRVPERPVLITAACFIGVLGALGSVPVILSDFAGGIGAWYAPYLAGSVAASLVCVAGLWKMRRWSVYLYAMVAATNQLVVYSMGIWHFHDLLVPAAFAAAVFSKIREMR